MSRKKAGTVQRMKPGDTIEVEASPWHGTTSIPDTRHKGVILHRTEGMILRIGPSTFGDPRLEIEMSFEEWGKVTGGTGGTGTLKRIRG